QARKGGIWPYVGDREHVAAVYDYTAARERAGPEKFLKQYRGHLQADAYVAYDAFFTKPSAGWWKWVARRTRAGIFIMLCKTILRGCARYCCSSPNYMALNEQRGSAICAVRSCACCANMDRDRSWIGRTPICWRFRISSYRRVKPARRPIH